MNREDTIIKYQTQNDWKVVSQRFEYQLNECITHRIFRYGHWFAMNDLMSASKGNEINKRTHTNKEQMYA